MKRTNGWAGLSMAGLLLAALLASSGCGGDGGAPPPPETSAREVVDEWHGQEVADPYRWLEDQDAPETRDWISRQNAYTDSVLGQLPEREGLRGLVRGLLEVDDYSAPTARGGRYFFMHRRAGQDLSVLYVRQGLEGEDEVLIDPHTLSDDHSVNIALRDVSSDGRLIVYALRRGGEDEVELHLMDVESKEELADVLPARRYLAAFLAPDKSKLYYSTSGTDSPGVFVHPIGGDPAQDERLFGEGYGRANLMTADLSPDGRWLAVTVLEGSSGPTAVFLKDMESRQPFQNIIEAGRSRNSVTFAGSRLAVLTDLDAPNYRIMTADPQRPQVEHWQEVIPQREDAVLTQMIPAGGRLVVSYLENVQPKAAVYDMEGNLESQIDFEAIGTVRPDSDASWDSDEIFVSFSSFHIPETIYRYDLQSGQRQEWAASQVPVNPEEFEVKQVRYPSKDGTQIPMFIVHGRGLEMDGSHPALLTGYGGFNLSRTPRFSAAGAAWVRSGGVYAVANLRGGGEFGEEWHRAGMLGNKQNVFDDFIAAAEYLIDSGYTSSQHLAISGGSNGGLLVGAAMTQRPELFAAVVCNYPLLDMLRYDKLLVGSFWISEYGSAENPDQYPYLKAYSPYHNVRQGTEYPATLFVTGDADTRVAPAHARKMTALVQSANASDNPILLRYHTTAGHAGDRPVEEEVRDMVEVLSFLLWKTAS
ncbi:MAG TPA: prolyl oligopeptidase family serine peptidase [Acidobacteriota bacterium]|nr:prolyl oligopeptidase family serine peptidase [Acidobacteriota bacterium]